MKNEAEAQVLIISTHEKTDGTEPSSQKDTESFAEETEIAIVHNKTLIFGTLMFLLGIISLGIVAKSSCGASFSLKLIPPEMQLNSSSCGTQAEQSQKSRVIEGQNMSANKQTVHKH